MKLYSTNDKSKSKTFGLKEAVAQGLAPDGGLFMPCEIGELSEDFWREFGEMSFQEVAFEVAKVLLDGDIPEDILKEMIEDAVNFEAPLKELAHVDEKVLELFHGPTLAFKDFGGRFMARLMRYVMKDVEKEVTILAATSGDTGSAVAAGFYKVPGFRVVLLYPKGKVSRVQEMQFATMGENVEVLQVDGSFDDCQRMVKQAFVDEELREKLILSSANSINIARLIPQTFYYFEAARQLLADGLVKDGDDYGLVFSVPSGNFGNLTAGLFAREMGLPITKMVASTNVNAIVPRYLETGNFEPKESIHTISNAMDIGNPSNFARMQELFGSVEEMREIVKGYSFSDKETREAISEVYEKFEYVMCPHTAVGYLGLKKYAADKTDNEVEIVLSTAHPAKFGDVVSECIGREVKMPARLAECLEKEKKVMKVGADYETFKKFLIK